MLKLFKEIDWELGCWLNQLAFYFVGCYICFSSLFAGAGKQSGWFYFLILSIILVVASFNVMLLRGTPRFFLSLLVIMVSTFVIPMTYFTCGANVKMAAAASLIYVIVSMAISPIPVGGAALVSGAAFACYQKFYYYDVHHTTNKDFLTVVAFYIAAALVAFCWRLLITRMYQIFTMALNQGGGMASGEASELQKELEDAKQIERLLKEEIAMHIIEMNTIAKAKK